MSDDAWNRRSLLKAAGLAGGSLLLGGLAPGSLAGRRAACDGATETTELTGSLSGADDAVTDSYALVTDDPCRVTLTLSSADATDFDLYVTTDGRTPTTGDYDRKSETSFVSEEQVVLAADALDPDATLGLLVDSYTAGGSYALEIEEVASGGGTTPEPNEKPDASFAVDRTTVPVGTEVSVDGSGSSDPDGSIAAYEWAFGDGTTATGQTSTHAFSTAGEYRVELTVTDDDGATDVATKTVTVESGGGGDCGTTETTTKTGTLSGSGDGVTYAYDAKTSDPCGVTFTLSGDSGTDFDLYVTLDGRTPTTGDYDERSYNYGSDESIELDDGDVAADATLGVLVDAYSGSGAFTLEIEERGAGGGETPPPNEGPTAAFSVDDPTVPVGTEASVDASGSSDPDGSIAAYEWAFGDGATATGRTAAHAYDAAGEYRVELTVTDDDGATDAATRTVTVESDDGGGGDCGTVRETASADGTLWGFFGGETYTYETRTGTPCQVGVSLDGPAGADFDLYVTQDGRTPTTGDYDAKSTSDDGQEAVVLDDVADVTQVGILVYPASGSGDFTVSVEELGR